MRLGSVELCTRLFVSYCLCCVVILSTSTRVTFNKAFSVSVFSGSAKPQRLPFFCKRT